MRRTWTWEDRWLKTGLGNIAEYVCRAARAATQQDFAQAAPEEANAVTENVNMALGKGAIVMPEQDHLAHLQVHMSFMQSPALGGSPLIAPAFLPVALKHCAEHILNYYATVAMQTVEQAARRKVSDLLSNDAQVKVMFDRLLAMASQND